MSWHMEMVTGSGADDIVERDFDTFEDGVAWLEEHEPRMLSQDWNSLEREDFKQFGTNYYWAAFERLAPESQEA